MRRYAEITLFKALQQSSNVARRFSSQLCTSIWSTKVFASTVSTLFKRIFRVYAILYSSFFQTFDALDLSAELNSCFKHFMFFSLEFQLLQDSEVAVLDIIVKPIKAQHMKSELEAKRKKENKAKRI